MRLFFLLICVFLFSSCSKDEQPIEFKDGYGIDDRLIGTWVSHGVGSTYIFMDDGKGQAVTSRLTQDFIWQVKDNTILFDWERITVNYQPAGEQIRTFVLDGDELVMTYTSVRGLTLNVTVIKV